MRELHGYCSSGAAPLNGEWFVFEGANTPFFELLDYANIFGKPFEIGGAQCAVEENDDQTVLVSVIHSEFEMKIEMPCWYPNEDDGPLHFSLRGDAYAFTDWFPFRLPALRRQLIEQIPMDPGERVLLILKVA